MEPNSRDLPEERHEEKVKGVHRSPSFTGEITTYESRLSELLVPWLLLQEEETLTGSIRGSLFNHVFLKSSFRNSVHSPREFF